MIIAATASSSIVDWTFAAVRPNFCTPRVRPPLRPPTSIAAPMTSRMLPMIEPTSEALTTSCRPLPSAKRAMISSGALPKVTLSSPPITLPERSASSSVARPIIAAGGIRARAETKKIDRRRGIGQVDDHRRRDQRGEQVRPAVGAQQAPRARRSGGRLRHWGSLSSYWPSSLAHCCSAALPDACCRHCSYAWVAELLGAVVEPPDSGRAPLVPRPPRSALPRLMPCWRSRFSSGCAFAGVEL